MVIISIPTIEYYILIISSMEKSNTFIFILKLRVRFNLYCNHRLIIIMYRVVSPARFVTYLLVLGL